MKFTTQAAEFLSALNSLRDVVRKQANLAIFETVKVEAVVNRVHISACNMEESMRVSIPATVEQDGAACIPLRMTHSAAQAMAGSETAEIHVLLDGSRVTLRGEGSEAKVGFLPATEFPAISISSYAPEFFAEVRDPALAADLKWLASCIDPSRPGAIYQCVHVVGGSGMAVTDSRMAGLVKCFDEAGKRHFGIPATAIPALTKLCDIGCTWSLLIDNDGNPRLLIASGEGFEFTTRLMSFDPPDVSCRLMAQFYSHAGNMDDANLWIASRDTLGAAVRHVTGFDSDGHMCIEGNGKHIHLSLEKDGSAFATHLPAEVPDEKRWISPFVLRKAMEASHADELEMLQKDNCWVIRSDRRTACMMGMIGNS